MANPKLLAICLSLFLATIPQMAVAQNFDQLVVQGNAALQAGQYSQAETIWRQALQLNPKSAYAYNNLGNALRAQHKLDQAIIAFNQAIKLDPSFASPYNNRGLIYSANKDYDRAFADFNQAIKLDPSFASPYNNRGLIYSDKKDYDHAIADFNQAIKLDPSSALAYNRRGNVYSAKNFRRSSYANLIWYYGRKYFKWSHHYADKTYAICLSRRCHLSINWSTNADPG